MPRRDALRLPYPRGLPRLEKLDTAFARYSKNPPIGVTQGGSSRASPGAKVAATTAERRQPKRVQTV